MRICCIMGIALKSCGHFLITMLPFLTSVVKQKEAGFPLQSKHWSFQSEELMKYFFKTVCILLLLISFIDSTYSQTLSLRSLNENKLGLEFAYNQTEFENWSRGVDATDHNMHLAVPIQLNDFSKLSIMPCVIYRNEKSGAIETDLNTGCYLRYTEVYDTTIPSFFFRVGGGGNSNNSDATKSFIWKAHGGAGIFGDLLENTRVPLKPFCGLFIQGEFERRIGMYRNYNEGGLDISTELGIEIKISEKQSLSITSVTYLFNTYGISNFYPKVYFSVRVL